MRSTDRSILAEILLHENDDNIRVIAFENKKFREITFTN